MSFQNANNSYLLLLITDYSIVLLLALLNLRGNIGGLV